MADTRTPRHNGPILIAVLFASLCFVVFVSHVLAQQTLKVEVNLVNVFATVKDDQGNFVKDLAKQDFRLYEDDKPQDIQIFEKQERVDSAIGLLMDTSGSMVDIMPFMKRGIRDFTRALPRSDEYFVVSFGTNVKLLTLRPSRKSISRTPWPVCTPSAPPRYSTVCFTRWRRSKNPNVPGKRLLSLRTVTTTAAMSATAGSSEEAQSSAVLLYFIAIGSPVLVDSHTLEPLSDLSGGRTLYVPKQEAISPVMDQIRNELSQQYYLGYYAPGVQAFIACALKCPGGI